MNLTGISKSLLPALVFIFFAATAVAQEHIYGTIYDHADGHVLRGVSVIAVSGPGTVSDSLGRYSLMLNADDSFYCSWLGVQTIKFAVSSLDRNKPFDLSLDTKNSKTLPSFSLIGNSYDYLQDSIRNREEYRKQFGYEGSAGVIDGVKMKERGGIGLGVDLSHLADAKSEKNLESLHNRLEQDEQDRYIDYRFTKPVAEQITHIHPPFLLLYMKLYRPTYADMRKYENDYEFYQAIAESGKVFNKMMLQRCLPQMLLCSCTN